jgi:predicted RNase H-like HicB family nuclease
MLLSYINAAMDHAKYQILPDGEGFYSEVPELPGVWANASTLEDCRRELQDVIESWIMAKLRHGDSDFPVLDGVDLNESSSNDAAVNGAVA